MSNKLPRWEIIQHKIFYTLYYLSLMSSLQRANPINSSNDIYLRISKSTHHPTNKKTRCETGKNGGA
jgi:hypothetical protein